MTFLLSQVNKMSLDAGTADQTSSSIEETTNQLVSSDADCSSNKSDLRKSRNAMSSMHDEKDETSIARGHSTSRNDMHIDITTYASEEQERLSRSSLQTLIVILAICVCNQLPFPDNSMGLMDSFFGLEMPTINLALCLPRRPRRHDYNHCPSYDRKYISLFNSLHLGWVCVSPRSSRFGGIMGQE